MQSGIPRTDIQMLEVDRQALAVRLDLLASPSSIAIIGASPSMGKLGNTILRSLVEFGYQGRLFPVNPRAESILGLKCYKDVGSLARSIGGPPDSVYITVPPSSVMDCVRDAASAGSKAITVFSSGLVDDDSRKEDAVAEIGALHKNNGMLLLGPNCLGIYNPVSRVTFNHELPGNTGPVVFLSQSGSMVELFVLSMGSRGIGTRLAVSTGNESMLTVSDFIDYAASMEGVRVIAAYIEEIRDPLKFVQSCRRLGRDTIVVVYKAGLTRSGGQAASSHTGAMAGSGEAYSSLFRKGNVIFARSFEEMVAVVTLGVTGFGATGTRVGVISAPGGLCVSLSDALDRAGFSLPEFGCDVKSRLHSLMPEGLTVRNPLDLTMAATTNMKLYTGSIRAVGASSSLDMLIVGAPTSYSTGEFAEAMREIIERVSLPVAVVWPGDTQKVRDGIKALGRAGIAAFRSPEGAASALALVVSRNNRCSLLGDILPPSLTEDEKPRRGSRWLTTEETAQLLSRHGIGNYDNFVVRDNTAAIDYCRRSGYPVVLKLNSEKLIHKSEAGGVVTGINSSVELEDAMDRLRKTASERLHLEEYSFTVSRQVSGIELFVGATRSLHGTVIGFGLGGILVELVGLKSFSLCPVSKVEAAEMIRESGLEPLTLGYRGYRLDHDLLAGLLSKISRLLASEEAILEMDINPLIANEAGFWPADVRVLYAP